jgi:fumarate reductase subunit C
MNTNQVPNAQRWSWYLESANVIFSILIATAIGIWGTYALIFWDFYYEESQECSPKLFGRLAFMVCLYDIVFVLLQSISALIMLHLKKNDPERFLAVSKFSDNPALIVANFVLAIFMALFLFCLMASDCEVANHRFYIHASSYFICACVQFCVSSVLVVASLCCLCVDCKASVKLW